MQYFFVCVKAGDTHSDHCALKGLSIPLFQPTMIPLALDKSGVWEDSCSIRVIREIDIHLIFNSCH
jgi:hypothetical protein